MCSIAVRYSWPFSHSISGLLYNSATMACTSMQIEADEVHRQPAGSVVPEISLGAVAFLYR